jgi:hypothetical protein
MQQFSKLGMLKKVEGGIPKADLCREHGVSNATFTTGIRSTVA